MSSRLSLALLRQQEEEDDLLLLAAAAWLLLFKRKKCCRTVWCRKWLMRRQELGAYDTLISEIRVEDQGSFINFMRVTPALFDNLLDRITPTIQKEYTNFREPISPGMRLAITLRYLATGK